MSATTVWTRLLWKDFQHTRLMMFGMVGTLMILQLVIVLVSKIDISSAFNFGIAFMSPLFLTAGCAGLMIGDERQSGTWDWNTGLPIVWWQSMASKIVVWIAVCCIGVGVLLACATIGMRLNEGRFPIQPYFGLGVDVIEVALRVVTFALVFFAFFVVFSFATLVFSETLSVMVGTSVVMLLAVITASESAELGVLLAVVLAAMVELTVATFRWRWGTGQKTQLSSLFRIWPNDTDTWGPGVWFEPSSRMPAGSQRTSLARLAWGGQGARMVGALVAAAIFLVIVSAITWRWERSFAMSILTVPVPVLLGVGVCASDQTSKRFRFLADRGVQPWTYLFLPLASRAALLLFAINAFTFVANPLETLQHHFLLTGAGFTCFGIGMLAAVCFRNTTVSSLLAMLTSIASFVTVVSINDNFFRWPLLSETACAACCLGMIPAIIVAIVYQVKRWFLLERSENPGLFIGAIALGLTVALVVCVLAQNNPLLVKSSYLLHPGAYTTWNAYSQGDSGMDGMGMGMDTSTEIGMGAGMAGGMGNDSVPRNDGVIMRNEMRDESHASLPEEMPIPELP